MKKFSLALTFLFLGIFINYIYNNPSVFDIFNLLSLDVIFLLLFIKSLTLLLNGLFNKTLLQAFEAKMNNYDSLYVGSITYLGNLFLPARIGGSLRLIFFNKKFKIKSSYLVSIFAYFFVIAILINSIFGIISVLLISSNFDITVILWTLFNLSFAVTTAYLLVNKFKVRKKTYSSKIIDRILNFIKDSKDGWNRISSVKKLNSNLLTIYSLNYLFFLLEILIIIYFIGENFNFLNIVFYNSISVISNLIGITPASLGIKEALTIFSQDLIGLSLDNIIEILLIERFIAILFSIIPFVITLLYDKKQIN
tara:strand:+ start:8825 stop:9751 length:927 start_codon:yes stop_codon:yes gene_type:complete